MIRISKGFVIASLVAAGAVQAWVASRNWPTLPLLVAATTVGALVAGRAAPRLAPAAICVFAYVVPAAVIAAGGRYTWEHLLMWLGAVLGLMLSTPGILSWAYPRRWRFPLVLWALTVAAVWPIVALREYDFAPWLVDQYRLGNSSLGGLPRLAARWVAHVAMVHLAGLLWLDWLFRRFPAREDLDRFLRVVAAPLAASAVLGSAVAIYQGLVDLTFLSGSAWPYVHRRAAGSMLDANAFGAAVALWTGGTLALACHLGWRRHGWWAAVAWVVCWAGLWMTASRTALAAALVVLLFAIGGRVRAAKTRRRLIVPALAVTVVAVIAIAGLARLPVLGETAVGRAWRGLPEVSATGARQFASDLWRRPPWGPAAERMIAEYPLTGVGVGACHGLLADYGRVTSGVPIRFDNAQNWFRHQVAELGVLGSVGLILWSLVLLHLLVTTRGEHHVRVPAAIVKGTIVALGLVSLVGVPTQNASVTLAFWTFVFWYVRLVGGPEVSSAATPLPRVAWAVMLAVVAALLVGTAWEARGSLRVPNRAARFDFPYRYGAYPEEVDEDGHTFRWTRERAVFVEPAEQRRLQVSAWVGHPDVMRRPVRVQVWVGGRRVIDRDWRAHAPVTRTVDIRSDTPRVVIEARVSRTWRQPDPAGGERPRDLGVALAWRFVAKAASAPATPARDPRP